MIIYKGTILKPLKFGYNYFQFIKYTADKVAMVAALALKLLADVDA